MHKRSISTYCVSRAPWSLKTYVPVFHWGGSNSVFFPSRILSVDHDDPPCGSACSIKYCLVQHLDASNFAWADGGSVQCYAEIEIYFASRYSASQWHLMQTHTRAFVNLPLNCSKKSVVYGDDRVLGADLEGFQERDQTGWPPRLSILTFSSPNCTHIHTIGQGISHSSCALDARTPLGYIHNTYVVLPCCEDRNRFHPRNAARHAGPMWPILNASWGS